MKFLLSLFILCSLFLSLSPMGVRAASVTLYDNTGCTSTSATTAGIPSNTCATASITGGISLSQTFYYSSCTVGGTANISVGSCTPGGGAPAHNSFTTILDNTCQGTYIFKCNSATSVIMGISLVSLFMMAVGILSQRTL